MNIKLLLPLLLLLSNFGLAQGGQVLSKPGGINYVNTAPSGSCPNNAPMEQVIGAGSLYTCQSGSWAQITGGGGGGATLQTNGTNNSSQTTLNLESSSATNGVTLTETNVSGGNVQLGLSGTLNNNGLANSAITIAGTSVSLGGSTSSLPVPGAIGGTTPAAITGTTITATTEFLMPQFIDGTEIAAPSNPAASTDRLYMNSSTHQLSCLTSSGGNCMPSGGGTTTNALTGNNTGSGAASGSTFNGASAVTWSYNTFGAPGLAAANTFSAENIFSANGALSTPGVGLTGTPITGGSGSTTVPYLYLDQSVSNPSTFSTAGTEIGINAPSGYTGNFEYYCVNGASPCPFTVTYQGNEIINQTAGTQFALNIENTTAATSSTSQNSPYDIRSGTGWYNPEFDTVSPPLAAASSQDCWSHQIIEANGSNGQSIYNIAHNNAVDTCNGIPSDSYVQVPYGASWGLQTNSLAQPTAPTVALQGSGTGGTWTYEIVALIGGVQTQPSSTTSTTGPTTINGTNWMKVTWSAVTNADYYEVYRTASGGTPSSTGGICLIPAGITLECDDKGLTGDATTAQAYNSTGQVFVGTGPKVGGGSGGGMFATQGTVPTVGASTASGWYANSSDGNVHVVNGVTSGTTPNDWGYATAVFGKTIQKAETGSADSNVLTVTPPSVVGEYRIGISISVASGTSCVVGWTATWHDAQNNAQTPTELALFQNGTAAPALTFTTSAAGNYSATQMIDTSNSGTNIVIKWIGGGTCSAKMTALVEKVN